MNQSKELVWKDELFPASLGKERRPFPKINFRLWGAIIKILGDGMIEVRVRWLMYRKATPDKRKIGHRRSSHGSMKTVVIGTRKDG